MSHNAKRIRVAILNPPDGCQASTSLERARRYAKQGRAVLDESARTLQFIADHHRHASTVKAARHLLRYDDGLLPMDQARNLPIAGPAIRMYTGRQLLTPPKEDRVVLLSTRFVLQQA